MAKDSVWELVFLMVILKIPIVYLVWVVWYAIKAPPPRTEEGAAITAVVGDEPPRGPRRVRRPPRLRPGPHRGPDRTYARSSRAAAAARAKLDW